MNETQDVEPADHTTEGFGERSMQAMPETAAMALAERAKAEVNALCIMAERRPRNLAKARSLLLADCKRPAFADVAIYRKPVGEGVEGPSIRMAEAAARAMTNIIGNASAIYDDREKRILRVVAMDLESNLTFWLDITVAKTIERSKPMPGRKILMQRQNSRGYPVFLIEAIDDEIMDKERALISKALRTCILRLIPGDILEEAMEACYRVREEEIKKDLPAARKKLVGAFALFGATEAQIAEYLGHAISDTTAEELNTLRSLHASLKDKETTWAEVMDSVKGQRAGTNDAPGSKLEDRLKDKAAAGAKPAAEPEPKTVDATATTTTTPASGGPTQAEMDATDAKRDADAKKKSGQKEAFDEPGARG